MRPDARLGEVARALARLRPRTGPFLVGVTGSVAVGKTTFAQALGRVLAIDGPSVEIACTDGFLLPNAVLEARGLSLRKGFPETYDTKAMKAVFAAVRKGSADFPVYSHIRYDVDRGEARRIEKPDILIIEGLGLRGDRHPIATVPSGLDALIFLDADEGDIETWFVDRFLRLRDGARKDPQSFYARFLDLDDAGALAMARWVWREINLPNLREHILPVMARSDLTVRKAADHKIASVRERATPT